MKKIVIIFIMVISLASIFIIRDKIAQRNKEIILNNFIQLVNVDKDLHYLVKNEILVVDVDEQFKDVFKILNDTSSNHRDLMRAHEKIRVFLNETNSGLAMLNFNLTNSLEIRISSIKGIDKDKYLKLTKELESVNSEQKLEINEFERLKHGVKIHRKLSKIEVMLNEVLV